MRGPLVCVTALLFGACIVQPAPATQTSRPPPPGEAYEEPPPDEAVVRGHREPAGEDVVRANEIRAGLVRARIIYAKEVKANTGSVGQVYEDRDTEEWERGRAMTRSRPTSCTPT